MSKLEERRKNLKKLGDWEERIKELGHEDEERGIKATIELQKEDDLKQDKEKNAALEKITRARRFTDDEYKVALCGWGKVALMGIKLPKKTFIGIYPTKDGVSKAGISTKDGIVVAISVTRFKGRGTYMRGIELSYIPEFDMRAIEDKVMEAIDFIDVLVKPPNGPNGYTNSQ